MRVFTLALLLISFTASAIEICKKEPFSHVYINGIYTTSKEASAQAVNLSKLSKTENEFQLVYNRYNGPFADLWETVQLKMAEQNEQVKKNFDLQVFLSKMNEDPTVSIASLANGVDFDWVDQVMSETYVKAHQQVEKKINATYSDEPLLFMASQFKTTTKPN